jgi:FAD synthetase
MTTKTKVMAFGTFDYLHAGHESYLKQASELGDQLIVVIARDRTANSIRGFEPDHNERKRMNAVKALPFVDKVILGEYDDKYKVIRKNKPNTIALGYDQFVFTHQLNKVLIELKLDTKIVRLESYNPEMYKSSIIRKNLKEQATKKNVSTLETMNEIIISDATPIPEIIA